MKKHMSLLAIAVLTLAATGRAQQAQLVFHPGDSVHILVTFKAAPKPLSSAMFHFALVGQPDKSQQKLLQSFNGNAIRSISDTQFEITGTIPEHAASGNFRLDQIQVSENGIWKPYQAGTDFATLTIAVSNPERDPDFPPITGVTLGPGN